MADFPGGWTLHRIPSPAASFLWPEFKLVNSGPRRWGRRRVYRLAWSPIEARLRRDQQRKLLMTTEPELAARVLLWLELERDRDWLLKQFTLSEIDMEAQRIRGRPWPLTCR